jgi:ABC-type multidrug transport system fused ATPase/permease subunit
MRRRKDASSFFGPRVAAILIGGTVLGLALSAVELAFAFSLQAFLVQVGALSPGAASLPSWLPGLEDRAFLALLVFGLLRASMAGAQTFLMGASCEELKFLIRSRLLDWAMNAESASTGTVMSHFALRTEAAGGFATNLQIAAAQAAGALLLGLQLLYLSPQTTGIVALATAALGVPLLLADRRVKSIGDMLALQWHRTNDRLLVSLRNLLLLQILGTQRDEERKAQADLASYREHVMTYFALSGLKLAGPQLLGILLVCGLSLTPIFHSAKPGLLVTYLYLMLRFLQSLSAAGQSFSALVLNWPQVKLLADWWNERKAEVRALPPKPKPSTLPLPERVGWSLNGVSFTYPGGLSPVLENVDVELSAGEALVITGPSGSGKSTLLGIMLGNLTPQAGRTDLSLDGSIEPLAANRERLLPRIGYVGPESFLIEGTIRENLVYGLKRAPSDAEIDSALALAECDFVAEMPKGLSHWLTELGQGLSAGQKQRLCLARALLRGPAVLVLDEATSNLDTLTEDRLVATLGRLKGRMTIIAVTHRPALRRLADRALSLGGQHPSPSENVLK